MIAQYTELFDHVGHGIRASYQDGRTPQRIIECPDCDVWLATSEDHPMEGFLVLWHYYTAPAPGFEAWTAIKEAFPVPEEEGTAIASPALDTESSTSRQHHIDTGCYLVEGEAT